MMKKNTIYFFLFLLSACSDKYQSLYNSAPSPGLSFSKDSIMIREKDYTNINGSNNGRLTFYCKSANNQMNIQFTDTGSKVHLLYRGSDLVNSGALR